MDEDMIETYLSTLVLMVSEFYMNLYFKNKRILTLFTFLAFLNLTQISVASFDEQSQARSISAKKYTFPKENTDAQRTKTLAYDLSGNSISLAGAEPFAQNLQHTISLTALNIGYAGAKELDDLYVHSVDLQHNNNEVGGLIALSSRPH
jgi:hypothetical protein